MPNFSFKPITKDTDYNLLSYLRFSECIQNWKEIAYKIFQYKLSTTNIINVRKRDTQHKHHSGSNVLQSQTALQTKIKQFKSRNWITLSKSKASVNLQKCSVKTVKEI